MARYNFSAATAHPQVSRGEVVAPTLTEAVAQVVRGYKHPTGAPLFSALIKSAEDVGNGEVGAARYLSPEARAHFDLLPESGSTDKPLLQLRRSEDSF